MTTRRLVQIFTRVSVPMVLAAALVWGTPSEADPPGEAKDTATKLLGVSPDRDTRKLTDGAQIDYAKKLGQDVVCLCGTCPRHTVTNCDCGWAHYNQRTIQLALLDGKTREDILQSYEQAYGLKVFPLPPDEGLGKLSYILPYVGAFAGLIFVIILGLRMRNRDPDEVAATAQDTEQDEARRRLARELDDID